MKKKYENQIKNSPLRRTIAAGLLAGQLLIPATSSAQETSQQQPIEQHIEESQLASGFYITADDLDQQTFDTPATQQSEHRQTSWQSESIGRPGHHDQIRPNLPQHELTQKMSDHLSRSTALFENGIGCTGSIITNNTGNPIGISTADHCLQNNIRYDEQGNGFWQGITTSGEKPIAYTGDVWGELTGMQYFDNFITPDYQDRSFYDIAFTALGENTPENVVNAYKESIVDIASLHTGQAAFGGGWPVNQPQSPGGQFRRQEIPLTILGTGTSRVSNGYQLQVIWTAVPELTQDGATCSPGISGSSGYIEQTVNNSDGTQTTAVKRLGTAAAYIDFSGLHLDESASANKRAELEQGYGFSFQNIAGLCGFAYETPAAETLEITPVTSWDSMQQIVTYDNGNIPKKLEQAGQELFDEHMFSRQYINGNVRISNNSNGPRSNYNLTNPYIVPVYNYNGYGLAFGYYDDDAPNKVGFVYMTLDELNSSNVQVFSRNQETSPALENIRGTVSYSELQDSQEGMDRFISSHNQLFGHRANANFRNTNEHSIHLNRSGQVELVENIQESSIALEQKHLARENFANTSAERISINGFVEITDPLTSNTRLVQNPYIWVEQSGGAGQPGAVVGFHNHHLVQDQLQLTYIESVSDLLLAPHNQNFDLSIQHISGAITSTDAFGEDGQTDSFVDEIGYKFGAQIPSKITVENGLFTMQVDSNGSILFIETEPQKGGN